MIPQNLYPKFKELTCAMIAKELSVREVSAVEMFECFLLTGMIINTHCSGFTVKEEDLEKYAGLVAKDFIKESKMGARHLAYLEAKKVASPK